MYNHCQISGIHHITAIASSASENLAFYEEVLGLRLVKMTQKVPDQKAENALNFLIEKGMFTMIACAPCPETVPGRNGACFFWRP